MSFSMITEVHGSGDPVLFIHGLGGTSNVFTPQTTVLSRMFECVRPDLYGSGRSLATGAFSLAELATAMAMLLELRGIQKAHVVGHSLGTIVCQRLAIQRPDLVRSLSLIGPLAAPPDPARPALAARASKARSEGMVEIADSIVQGGLSADTKAHRPEIAACVREMLMRQPAEGYALTCEALAAVEPANISAIRCPTLLITGDEDGTAPPRNVAKLASEIPGAKLEILDRCGHWATFERSNEVNHALMNFLVAL